MFELTAGDRAHFKRKQFSVTLKYIAPSYVIRRGPANAADSIFSDSLARHAVHAGMAGKTDLAIGRWHDVGFRALDPQSVLRGVIHRFAGDHHFARHRPVTDLNP